jgi:hypothetical protein
MKNLLSTLILLVFVLNLNGQTANSFAYKRGKNYRKVSLDAGEDINIQVKLIE